MNVLFCATSIHLIEFLAVPPVVNPIFSSSFILSPLDIPFPFLNFLSVVHFQQPALINFAVSSKPGLPTTTALCVLPVKQFYELGRPVKMGQRFKQVERRDEQARSSAARTWPFQLPPNLIDSNQTQRANCRRPLPFLLPSNPFNTSILAIHHQRKMHNFTAAKLPLPVS